MPELSVIIPVYNTEGYLEKVSGQREKSDYAGYGNHMCGRWIHRCKSGYPWMNTHGWMSGSG